MNTNCYRTEVKTLSDTKTNNFDNSSHPVHEGEQLSQQQHQLPQHQVHQRQRQGVQLFYGTEEVEVTQHHSFTNRQEQVPTIVQTSGKNICHRS